MSNGRPTCLHPAERGRTAAVYLLYTTCIAWDSLPAVACQRSEHTGATVVNSNNMICMTFRHFPAKVKAEKTQGGRRVRPYETNTPRNNNTNMSTLYFYTHVIVCFSLSVLLGDRT